MILFNKVYKYLYIFFLLLIIIFVEFSTNFVKAKNFTILDVEIKEEYTLNFDKSKALNIAFRKAFEILISKILNSEDKNILKEINLNQIKTLVENFSIKEEKFIDDNYQSKINVEFNKKEVIIFLNSKGLITSSIIPIDVIILPILIDLNKKEIFTYTKNPFFLNWNLKNKKFHQINYILPNEDIEDFSIIRNNIKNIENYDFDEIFNKYNIKNRILLVLLKEESEIKIFSKLIFENVEMYMNNKLNVSNLDDLNDVNKSILDIKNEYENKWKSINKINTSIILPIRLSINSDDYILTNKFEQKLNEIDLVASYEIEKLNSKFIVYKIIFNGTPDKFLKIMKIKNFNLDTSGEIWKIQ